MYEPTVRVVSRRMLFGGIPGSGQLASWQSGKVPDQVPSALHVLVLFPCISNPIPQLYSTVDPNFVDEKFLKPLKGVPGSRQSTTAKQHNTQPDLWKHNDLETNSGEIVAVYSKRSL